MARCGTPKRRATYWTLLLAQCRSPLRSVELLTCSRGLPCSLAFQALTAAAAAVAFTDAARSPSWPQRVAYSSAANVHSSQRCLADTANGTLGVL